MCVAFSQRGVLATHFRSGFPAQDLVSQALRCVSGDQPVVGEVSQRDVAFSPPGHLQGIVPLAPKMVNVQSGSPTRLQNFPRWLKRLGKVFRCGPDRIGRGHRVRAHLKRRSP
ncbi:MAG TPA: hypothetical protein DDX19_26575 [Rhodopirellula baltica]|nr:hypothetical protein [Rhodopirellula baltica]